MLVATSCSEGEYPWPASLTWQELPGKLDDAQTWLLEQRTAADPNIVFAILDGFRALAEWLVTAFIDVARVADLGRHDRRVGADRAALRRLAAALIVFGAFVSFALMGLWEESIQTLGLMSAAVLLSLAIGIPLGVFAGRYDRFHRAITPGARRDADRARVRLPDADRDPVLGRPGGGGDLHDDLRDPAGGADHGARHPRRDEGLGRGGAARSARRGHRRSSRSSCRWPGASCCCRSTRRSCSRSRSW